LLPPSDTWIYGNDPRLNDNGSIVLVMQNDYPQQYAFWNDSEKWWNLTCGQIDLSVPGVPNGIYQHQCPGPKKQLLKAYCDDSLKGGYSSAGAPYLINPVDNSVRSDLLLLSL